MIVSRSPLAAVRTAALALGLYTLIGGGPVPSARADVPAAAPDPALEEAKGHFIRGAQHYERARYDEALVEFKRSYELAQLPDLLYNLARTEERLGHYREAARYLETYLQKRPDAEDRAQAQADITRLSRTAEALERAAEPPPPPIKQTPLQLPPWPSMALAGGGVVCLIIGMGLGGAAIQAAKDIDAAARFDPALDQRGKSLNAGAITMDVLGVAALAGGATWIGLWYFRDRHKAQPPKAWLAPQGLGLQLVGSF